MKKRITVQKMSSKQGTGKNGKPYTKYMVMSVENKQEVWYSQFNPINAVEGGEYDIEYNVSKFGNDLISVEPVSETENKLQNNNRQNSIIRQHSQEMALYYFDITDKKDFTEEELKEKIQWFANDADQEMPF